MNRFGSFALLSLFLACGNTQSPHAFEPNTVSPQKQPIEKNATGNTIATRFECPAGFERVPVAKGSFAEYLRNLPLKDENSPVYLYNGSLKGNQGVHAAVVSMDVGKKDLQQCADAVMRLRAEYLWSQKRYSDIKFHLTNGFLAEYTKWREGNRMVVSGNKVSWSLKASKDESYENFKKYLESVYMYAGTLSLDKEMISQSYENIEIGNVFIKGGSPGHCVLIVDMVVNPSTKEKRFLIVQSYMPAQDIHVLKNLEDSDLSPWYSNQTEGSDFPTPEWSFQKSQLKKF